MSALLWKSYLEHDFDLFQQLLDASHSGTAAQYGSGPAAGTALSAAGSPGRALSAGSPNLKGRTKAAGRLSGGKAKQSHDPALTRADINSKDAHGVTILHQAASSTAGAAYAYAHALLSNQLLDLYVQDHESGWTALHRALYSGNVAIARELMVRDIHDFTSSGGLTHAGGLIKIKDHEGNSPFDVYARTTAPRLIPHTGLEALLPAGSDDEDEDDTVAGNNGNGNADLRAQDMFRNAVTMDGDELFMFGTNKNLTLGFGDQDDRQFPERIVLNRPDPLLQRFQKEHSQSFPQGPFASTVSDEQVPAYVRFKPLQIQEVQLSKLHSAVLTTDPQANLYICGFGPGGRLGTGDLGTRFTFTSILGGGLQTRKIVAIGLGQDHTLAVTSEGEVFSWGSDRYGQLGYAVASSDLKDEEPIQLSPRQLFGPLKREVVVGCAASRVHSVVFTSTSLFTFGKNDGQLGLVDSDARLLEKQTTPRKVAASLFSSPIVMVTAIDKATTCLLENHDVWIFANFGYRKVPFPLSNPDSFIRDSFSAVDRRDGPNKIVQISSGGDTVCALARFGEVFNVTVSQKMDAATENSSSTTHPNKIRGALSTPQRVWSPRKDHMAAVDVNVGQDGSVILCTQSGSVWRKVKRAKIKDSNPMQIDADHRAKDYKFSRVPGLTEIRGVRSNAFGAFAAIRKENSVLKEQIRVSSSRLWDEMFPLLSFSGFQASNGPSGATSDTALPAGKVGSAPVGSAAGAVRRAVLTSNDIETDLSNFFERHGPSRSSDYDVKVGSTVSNIRIPCHQFVLMGRSVPLQKALLTFRKAYFSEIPDVFTVEYDKEGIASVIFQGLDILSVVNIVFYLYTDNIIPVWNIARKAAEFGPRYRQVRIEVMKAAAQLEFRGLEKAARLMSEPAKSLHKSLDAALSAPEFLTSGDIEVQLEDGLVRVHSAFVCQRCPFFEGMFHGRAGGGWLASRKEDMDEDEDLIKVDLEHIDTTTFLFVVRYLYSDVDDELFSDCQRTTLDDFLDTVLDVLAVANELMIDRLAQICQKVVGKYATMRNLCWLLNAMYPCSVTEFKNAALECICLNLEGMMENRLLDELDEDILVELGEAVRANQLAYLPISKSEDAEARLFEEHPDLIGRVEQDRKVKIDYMMLRSHLIEDEAKLAKLERSSTRRITSSAGDLMFDMDEDKVEPGTQKHSSRWSSGSGGAGDQDDVVESPPSSLPAEGVWRGKADSPAIGSLTIGSAAAVTPLGHQTLESATSAASTEQVQGGPSPWIAPSFQTSKLNMKEIMAQASEGKESNISAAFAAASSPSTQARSSHFGKLSQKERKRQLQAQKEAAAKSAEAAVSPSTEPARLSPWQIPSIRPSVSIQEETANAGPSRSTDQRRASGSPSLTMRQTIPGNVAAARKSSAISSGSKSHLDDQRRSVSSPAVHQTSPNANQIPAKPQPRPSPTPNVPTTPSKSSPIIPKSIRHIPPAPTLEPSAQSSMADILTQQQTEKSALRAAASKRSLQEIQEEQAFQEWWDQEEAATKARMEQEAAAAAAAEAKVKGAASGRGRARGRGGRGRGGSGQSGRGRGRRGSAAADESAAVEGGSRGKGTGAGADSGKSAGDKDRDGRNATRAARRASGKRPSPAATSES